MTVFFQLLENQGEKIFIFLLSLQGLVSDKLFRWKLILYGFNLGRTYFCQKVLPGHAPGRSDYPLNCGTAYSIGLNCPTFIKGWKKAIKMLLEEDGYFEESGFRYINGRQKEMILIPKQLNHIGN